MTVIQKELFKLRDLGYRDFNSKLIPNIDKNTIIGVRIPQIREIAKNLYIDNNYYNFIKKLPHKYFEEYLLHINILNLMVDYDNFIKELDKLLPFIDNWVLSDAVNPKVIANHKEEFIKKIDEYLTSNHTYTIRVGIVLLMTYIKEDDSSQYIKRVIKIKSDDYYVNMAIAWFYSILMFIIRMLQRNLLIKSV